MKSPTKSPQLYESNIYDSFISLSPYEEEEKLVLMGSEMERVEIELERRSKFLSSLIQKTKKNKSKEEQEEEDERDEFNVRIRASDMPQALQNRAFRLTRDQLNATLPGKPDNKRVALALKKDFDSAYGPAWHCIVGTSFGSYVTHSLGGFIYFQMDKVYVLLFKTTVEPLQ